MLSLPPAQAASHYVILGASHKGDPQLHVVACRHLYNAADCASLRFENHLRQRLSRRVRDAECNAVYAELLCNFCRFTGYR